MKGVKLFGDCILVKVANWDMADFMHFLIFLANRARILYGNSGDYHLSIGIEKSRFWALFVIFDFWALTKGVASQVWGLKTRPTS